MNLLIDGSSLLHRVHWINDKRNFKTSSGEDFGDIYMFLNSIRCLAKLFNTRQIYIAWDKRIIYPSTNFRQQAMDGEYKAHRDKEKNKSVYSNEKYLVLTLQSLGIKNIYPRTMEADDVISWLSVNLTGPNVVVSTDGDLLQLITSDTSFYHPYKKKLIDVASFEKDIGINQSSYLYYKAILGDVSDNIPGVVGYGKVKAKKLAKELIDDPNCLEKLDQTIKNVLIKNLSLMNLSMGYSLAGPEEVVAYKEQLDILEGLEPNLDKFKEYCNQFEFHRFLKGFNEWESIFGESRLLTVLKALGTR